jgi:ABC-type Fe3+ transport system permease subunit
VKNEPPATFVEPLLAWGYSIGFAISIATLIYERVQFGYDSQSVRRLAILLLLFGPALLLRDIFFPRLFQGHSQGLRKQSIYANVWITLLGGWLWGTFWGDFGLVLLISIALVLWLLSHREVLRLKRSRNEMIAQ